MKISVFGVGRTEAVSPSLKKLSQSARKTATPTESRKAPDVSQEIRCITDWDCAVLTPVSIPIQGRHVGSMNAIGVLLVASGDEAAEARSGRKTAPRSARHDRRAHRGGRLRARGAPILWRTPRKTGRRSGQRLDKFEPDPAQADGAAFETQRALLDTMPMSVTYLVKDDVNTYATVQFATEIPNVSQTFYWQRKIACLRFSSIILPWRTRYSTILKRERFETSTASHGTP